MAGAKILIVDNEGIEALDIQRRLMSLGFPSPEVAGSGEEAVKKAEELSPDLVLMDIMLPGSIDGVTAAKQIRELFDIPVIYLTAYADEGTLQRARITEPYGYIVKPFQERELHLSIEIALYKHSMERRLKESERWLSTTLRSIGDAVIATDRNGRITFMNAVGEDLTGWKSKDASGRPLAEVFRIINRDTRRSGEDPVAKVIREGHIAGLANHTLLIAKGGEEKPIDDSAAPIKDDKGHVIGVVLVFRDLGERRKAEEELRHREKELRTILNAGPTVVAYVDADGRYRRVNKSYEQWLGRPARECEGRLIWEVVGEPAWKEIQPKFERALSGETVIYEQELTFSGCAPRYVSATYTPDHDDSGRVRGVVVHAADIGERKRTEEAIRSVKEEWELTFNTVPDLIVMLDTEHRVLRANKAMADRFGVTPEQCVGKRCYEVVHGLSHPPQFCPHALTCLDGEEHVAEVHEPRLGGDFLVSTTPVRDGASRLVGTIHVARDITQRKQDEEALRRARDELEQRVKERTAELSQTVEALRTEVARRTVVEQALHHRSEQLRALASELTLTEQRERQRLAHVLHDGLQQTLVAAKIRLGIVERTKDEAVRREASRVGDLLQESLEASRLLIAELSPPILREAGLVAALEWLARWAQDRQGLTVFLKTHEPVGPLAEDLTVLFFQAARELLFNVVKHAGVKAARVQVGQVGEQLSLAVEDDGVGFDPSHLRAEGGLSGGFGLFSIRERLDLLGGKMDIQSAPGRGSRFTLIAPLRIPPGERAPATGGQPRVSVALVPPSPAVAAGGRARIRVVLVDDHIVMRQGLAALLRQETDIEIVGEASDGESAVTLIKNVRPNVILMDVSMPRMNGIEATRVIHDTLPEARVIGLSMFEEPERANAMRQAGAVEYLAKSGPSAAIIAAIRASAGADKA